MDSRSDDKYLVARVAVFGDRRAFDVLVCKYQSRLRRFFLSQTLGDEQLSDDLAQDTFVKAYLGIAGFRGLASFSTWLFRIACRVLYDYARQHRHTDDIDVRCEVQGGTSPVNAGLGIDLYRALAMLRPEERMCITLQLVEGQPVGRIADITGLPENTVKSHLHRGKEKLVDYLRKNGYDEK